MSEQEETRYKDATWHIEYEHAMGDIAQEFFRRTENDAEIYGRHCPGCDRTLLPPRSFCDQCYVETDDWEHVADEGEIHSITVQHYSYEGLPEPPLAITLIDLDGADTNMLHWVDSDELDLSDPKIARDELSPGTRVKAKWKDEDERTGEITDIQHFEPV
jgi:uncharacterized OB-fold protein